MLLIFRALQAEPRAKETVSLLSSYTLKQSSTDVMEGGHLSILTLLQPLRATNVTCSSNCLDITI